MHRRIPSGAIDCRRRGAISRRPATAVRGSGHVLRLLPELCRAVKRYGMLLQDGGPVRKRLHRKMYWTVVVQEL